jgi:hypothetical protein
MSGAPRFLLNWHCSFTSKTFSESPEQAACHYVFIIQKDTVSLLLQVFGRLLIGRATVYLSWVQPLDP